MGFATTRYAILLFPDSEWDGAEVRVKCSVTVEDYFFGPMAGNNIPLMRPKRGVWNWIKRIFHIGGDGDDALHWMQYFADDLLVSWNLEDDDGKPIPANFEGAKRVDIGFMSACAAAWVQSIGKVSDPLDHQSHNGIPSAGASPPTEALFPDLSSYSTPN